MNVPNFLLLIALISFGLAEKAEICEEINAYKQARLNIKQSCLLTSYLRGEGTHPSICDNSEEESGGFCFPKCKRGFSGVGSLCLKNCPPSYLDNGSYCNSPSPYSRNPGFALSDFERCESESSTRKCERYGNLYYSTCEPGYYLVGCCVCLPECEKSSSCGGANFKKEIYERGPGKLMLCEEGKDSFEGLCYPECHKGFIGIGPICYGECPVHLKQCGFFCIPHWKCCSRKTDHIMHDLGTLIHDQNRNGGHEKNKIFIDSLEIMKSTMKSCNLHQKYCKASNIKKLVGIIPEDKISLPVCHQ